MSDNATTYDLSIHSNPDARAWARFFEETRRKNGWPSVPDEETMLGWFANAMMARHDFDAKHAAAPSPSAPPDDESSLLRALHRIGEDFGIDVDETDPLATGHYPQAMEVLRGLQDDARRIGHDHGLPGVRSGGADAGRARAEEALRTIRGLAERWLAEHPQQPGDTAEARLVAILGEVDAATPARAAPSPSSAPPAEPFNVEEEARKLDEYLSRLDWHAGIRERHPPIVSVLRRAIDSVRQTCNASSACDRPRGHDGLCVSLSPETTPNDATKEE